MSEPFVGEIKMFAGTFAPRSFAFCDGQLMLISQNTALFSLLGTTYGGDGERTFALPDLRGRSPVHAGQGSGLSPRTQGQKSGSETVMLNTNQLPSHTHRGASTDPATLGDPGGNVLGNTTGSTNLYQPGSGQAMASQADLQPTGASQSHNNMMPFLGIHFIIALFGIFPSE